MHQTLCRIGHSHRLPVGGLSISPRNSSPLSPLSLLFFIPLLISPSPILTSHSSSSILISLSPVSLLLPVLPYLPWILLMFSLRAARRFPKRIPLGAPRRLHGLAQSKFFNVSEEVRDAVAVGKPVVALESTIYTHGMPSPPSLVLVNLVDSLRLPLPRECRVGKFTGVGGSSQWRRSGYDRYSRRSRARGVKCGGAHPAGIHGGAQVRPESLPQRPRLYLWPGQCYPGSTYTVPLRCNMYNANVNVGSRA